MENIVIIGSGPAAHTAAIYSARARLNPLMYEGMMAGGVAAGGQLTTTTEVENYPGFPEGISGPELMVKMREQSVRCGARIETKTVDRVDLGRGGGISACAVCDGGLPIFRNKVLVVIGGGDTACEEALYLTKFAGKVIMLVRRDVLRASKAMQERVRVLSDKKIEVRWNTNPLEARGQQKLEAVRVKNNKTGEESILEAGGLFYAIGHQPNTAFLSGQLALDEVGYIKTVPGTTKTSVEGAFACGDVQDKVYRQAVTAAGSGCMAALEAERYLSEHKI